jgi:ribosomal protein L37AE/L43A
MAEQIHGMDRTGVRFPVGPQMKNTKKFQRRIEDFVCEKCGAEVKGNGYTDHCSNCLWGKHVDVNPGDRVADCSGMMEPISVVLDHGENIIIYKCEKCGYNFRVKSLSEDNFEVIMNLVNKPS